MMVRSGSVATRRLRLGHAEAREVDPFEAVPEHLPDLRGEASRVGIRSSDQRDPPGVRAEGQRRPSGSNWVEVEGDPRRAGGLADPREGPSVRDEHERHVRPELRAPRLERSEHRRAHGHDRIEPPASVFRLVPRAQRAPVGGALETGEVEILGVDGHRRRGGAPERGLERGHETDVPGPPGILGVDDEDRVPAGRGGSRGRGQSQEQEPQETRRKAAWPLPLLILPQHSSPRSRRRIRDSHTDLRSGRSRLSYCATAIVDGAALHEAVC